ncbi:hypothetical protein JMM63_13355 [Rhodovulum sulfidophilum]|uniref:DUF6524 family protein n=1 Tax=Rhodovulum sulfidophilum TaxID=35806 RepID=UPI000950D688|nr:DUF6524 family protein [Rhodovulum sulfidophilum]MBL3596540.1 hypothetical protein [Rhodovulum sulfidophilum]MCE8419487.1 DUF6524 family protein [Rhodovulum sulfidophilum]MCE8440247.1 DUF6524 family protein [Rhodovulum sulfidophilum]MCE8470438.1 DUF6524 family protein [Rhodovulum sulfidophilum]OLS52862.1 hypothetical protein BV392_13220 [Rhodovulum sulfidophilum]
MAALFLRWLVAFLLLALTYNPTSWNYLRWAMSDWDSQTPMVVLAGLVLFTGYVIYLRATLRSIGPFGMALVTALVGALLWVLVDWKVLRLDNPGLNTWIGLLALSFILGVGLAWSILRRRLSGQADIDDVDE